MNGEAVCRTAPATPGLLITVTISIGNKPHTIFIFKEALSHGPSASLRPLYIVLYVIVEFYQQLTVLFSIPS